VLNRSFADFLIPDNEKASVLPQVYRESDGHDPQLLPHSINNNLTRDGRTISCEWFNAWLPDRPGEPRCIISLATDITERRRLEDQIHHLAFYDPLTGLPNRRLLHDRFDMALAAAGRTPQLGALLFIDLDNFKPLNDLHGHEAGDQLLVDAARRLDRSVRSCDTVARFGGDEFVVLLSNLDCTRAAATEQAEAIAAKLLDRLVQPYHLSTQTGEVFEHICSASIGIAVFDRDSKADEVIRHADHAMYRAKECGRRQFQTDRPTTETEASAATLFSC